MVEGLAFLGGLVSFEILAVRFGVSSKDGSDWSNNLDSREMHDH